MCQAVAGCKGVITEAMLFKCDLNTGLAKKVNEKSKERAVQSRHAVSCPNCKTYCIRPTDVTTHTLRCPLCTYDFCPISLKKHGECNIRSCNGIPNSQIVSDTDPKNWVPIDGHPNLLVPRSRPCPFCNFNCRKPPGCKLWKCGNCSKWFCSRCLEKNGVQEYSSPCGSPYGDCKGLVLPK
jgi:hypothetical protein